MLRHPYCVRVFAFPTTLEPSLAIRSKIGLSLHTDFAVGTVAHMETQTKRIYLFADYRLDATDCQLRRRGEVIALPPKVFDMLRVLVENRGRILDKEFLMKALWPDTYVEDGTLAQYIFLLRKALHEDSSENQFIETVPRRGYRFIAPVQEVNETAGHERHQPSTGTSHLNGAPAIYQTNGTPAATNAPKQPATALPPPKSSLQLLLAILVGVLIVVLVTGLYFYWSWRRPEQPLPSQQAMHITKLTANGKAGVPVLSPDSKYVAYRIDEAGKQSVMMRQLAAANAVQIVPPAETEIIGLAFSPDGNYLYYTAYQRPPVFGALYRVPALGGSPVKLLDDIDSPVTFAPDGKHIAFVRLAPLEKETYVMTANADGTQMQKLATRKHPDYFADNDGVSWSPDGKLIACPAGSVGNNGPFMNVVGLNAQTGQETLLTAEQWRTTGQVAWRKDGSGLVAVAWKKDSPIASNQLWFFPYPDGSARKITNDLNVYDGVSLSRDSRQLVTIQSAKVANFWLVPEGDAKRAVQIGGQSLDNHAHRLGLTWTPDGNLIYGSHASGNADLWRMDTTGNNTQQLTADPNLDLAPTVSGDGHYIAFVSNRSGGLSIWRMNADGSNVLRLTNGPTDHFPCFTPDGKWVLYTSNWYDQPTVWKVPAEGGTPVQFTSSLAIAPAVSPDGKSVALYYAVPQELLLKLAIVPIAGGEPTKIFDAVLSESPAVRWSADGRQLIYVNTKQGISNLWGQPVEGGSPKQLTDFKADRIFRFAWATDGKTLVCERGFYVNDVVLMSDFLS